MAQEHRKSPRVRTDFGVKYKVKGSASAPTKAVSVNIGEGGIMLKTSKKLLPGSIVQLTIVLPNPYTTIKTQGRVTFVLNNYWGGYPAYRCGVAFVKLKQKDRQTIKKFVNDSIARLDWDHWI
ncbi:PilZ domain-containing protein [Candidatus Omnitrophota bacterium]